MPIDATDIQDQLLLGRFRILEMRGEGGFGTVYVCWDPRLMRRVAIKAIPLHNAEPVVDKPRLQKRKDRAEEAEEQMFKALEEERQRTVRLHAALAETRTASMLSNASIVSILEFENDDENAYIIMEYVEGASLAELLDASDDGLLTADEAAAVVEAVADALQFAHENGVLHLDIKPDNILIDGSGRVKLADFGMAALSSAAGYTGARGGTVGYMPPEQITGEGADVRTDVFAFACVMYEALTGVRPFSAPTGQRSLELVEQGAADPCAYNAWLSPQAADALLVALSPDPDMRPSSVEAFGEELLAGLGKPKAGRKSLALFVAEVRDDSSGAEEPADDLGEAPGIGADVWYDAGPLSMALPRLARRALRAVGGLACGATSALAAASMLPPGEAGALPVGALACGAAVCLLGVAAPQLAGALALVALVAACLVAHAWPLALAVLGCGAAWWLLAARRAPLGSAPTLVCCIAPQTALPLAALAAGWLQGAGQAALGAACGFVAAATLAALSGAPALGDFTVAGLGAATPVQVGLATAALAGSWGFWLTGAGWVGAAAAMGALCRGGSKARCYLGCLCAACVLLCFQLVGARMENDGSWAGLSTEALVATVGSSILMGMFVFLLGAPRALDVDGDAAGFDDADVAGEGD